MLTNQIIELEDKCFNNLMINYNVLQKKHLNLQRKYDELQYKYDNSQSKLALFNKIKNFLLCWR